MKEGRGREERREGRREKKGDGEVREERRQGKEGKKRGISRRRK